MSELDGSDGVLWGIITTEDKDQIKKECSTTFYKFLEKKVEPGELGFKYSVLTIKENEQNEFAEAEFLRAYIGDVQYFVTNQAKAGWSGLMVKEGVVPKKTMKSMFKILLDRAGLPTKNVRSILSQM